MANFRENIFFENRENKYILFALTSYPDHSETSPYLYNYMETRLNLTLEVRLLEAKWRPVIYKFYISTRDMDDLENNAEDLPDGN